MTISFNSIPIDVRTPGSYLEVDNRRAVTGSPLSKKALLLGQKITAGTIAVATPVQVISKAAGEAYFGRGSMLDIMCKAFLSANPHTEMWAIALADAGGATAATFTITVTGTASAAGNVYVYVCGRRVVVPVPSGTVQNSIAALIEAALDLETDLPFTFGVSANVVTATARNGGTVANEAVIELNRRTGEVTVAGATVAVAAGVTGATDPDVGDTIAVFGADTTWDVIASPWNDDSSMEELAVELATRWGPMIQRPAHAFLAAPGSQGTLTSLGNGVNSPHLTILGIELTTPTWSPAVAACLAAVDAAEPDPARPRQTLLLTGVEAAKIQNRFSRTERQILLTDGIATQVADDSGAVRIERLITTNQLNDASIADVSYLDRTTLSTLAEIRRTLRERIGLRFPRHKLASDGTRFAPGQAVVTPALIKSEILAQFVDWETAGLVEGFDQFLEELIVERDTTDKNRVNVRLSPDLLNSFIVLAGQVQFIL